MHSCHSEQVQDMGALGDQTPAVKLIQIAIATPRMVMWKIRMRLIMMVNG